MRHIRKTHTLVFGFFEILYKLYEPKAIAKMPISTDQITPKPVARVITPIIIRKILYPFELLSFLENSL